MKKLAAVLAFSLLTGCGSHGLTSATSATAAALAAQSKAQAEKAVHAIFKASFKAADKNGDGKLTIDEMPGALPTMNVPGVSGATPKSDDDAKALFAQLDVKKQGYVGYREFCAPANQAPVLALFRTEVAAAFAQLDKNGDHNLSNDELVGTPFGSLTVTPDKRGNVTVSVFENAFAATFSAGAEPPADPNTPPAPAASPSAAPADPNAPPAPTAQAKTK